MEHKITITDILVVDDDKLICLLLSTGLRRNISLPVALHHNGKTALEQITKWPNKNFLVLLDLNMPVMNGWEFLEELNHRELTNFRVVLISSSVNASDKSRAFSFPQVIDYFEKPLLAEQYLKLEILMEKGVYR